jgi:nicotianamine synthase
LPLTSMCLLRSLSDGTGPETTTVVTEISGSGVNDDDGRELVEKQEVKQKPSVVNIDHDATALAASAALCEKLGAWSRGMAFRCSDAGSEFVDLGGFDVVFLAALVGTTQREKEDIVVSVARRMKAGALMVVRSAHGLRMLLYPVSAYIPSRQDPELAKSDLLMNRY